MIDKRIEINEQTPHSENVTKQLPPGLTRFLPDRAELALDVDQPRADRARALGAAFWWKEAPQGGPYWFEQQDQIALGDLDDWVNEDPDNPRPTDLSPEAVEQLRTWIAASTIKGLKG